MKIFVKFGGCYPNSIFGFLCKFFICWYRFYIFSVFLGFLPDFLFQNENICKVCWLRRPRCYPTSFSPTIHPGLAAATKAPNIPNYPSISSIAISKYPNTLISNILFLDAIASPSTYPCQWVSGSLIVSDWRLLLHLRALRACFSCPHVETFQCLHLQNHQMKQVATNKICPDN